MATNDALRGALVEIAAVQAAPITDQALAERMRTEATTWMNAVHIQYRRIMQPLTDPAHPDEAAWRREIDLQFLLVTLTRLRRAVQAMARTETLHNSVSDLVRVFDEQVPALTRLRNVAEHFDDYSTDVGRDSTVARWQLQSWSVTDDKNGLSWHWLGETFRMIDAYNAARVLYSDFVAKVDNQE